MFVWTPTVPWNGKSVWVAIVETGRTVFTDVRIAGASLRGAIDDDKVGT